MPGLGKLYSNSAVYALGSIAGKAIGFLMIPVYTRCLTPADYGTIELMYRATDVISLIAALGLGAAVMRFYFDCKDQRSRNEVVSTALLMVIVTGIFLAAVACLASGQISIGLFGHPRNALLMQLAVIAMLLDLIVMVPLSYIQAEQKALLFTIFGFGKLLLGLALNILLIVHLRMGVLGVAWSAVLSSLVCTLILLPMIITETGLSFSKNRAIAMFYYGLPMIPGQFTMFVLSFADRITLQRYSGVAQVGIYSLGYKFGMLISLLVAEPYLRAWTPYALAQTDRPGRDKSYSDSLRFFTIAAMALTLLLSLTSRTLISIMASKAFAAAYAVVPLIAMAHAVRAMGFQMELGILISKKTVYRILTGGVSAGVYVVLCILLVPKWGAAGAGWATLLSYIFFTVISYIVSQRLYPVVYDFKPVVGIMVLGTAIYLTSLLITTNARLLAIGWDLLLLISYPLLLTMFGLLHKKEVYYVKNRLLDLGRGRFKPSRKKSRVS